MAGTAIFCPACGAPAQIPFGKASCICEYCGSMVQRNMTEAEAAHIVKNKEAVDDIKAAIHSIANRDYKSALKYADKAVEITYEDPGPYFVRYLACLDLDYKKAKSSLNMARSMSSSKDSVLSDSEYDEAKMAFAQSYLSAKGDDIKRMFLSMRSVGPKELENVRNYERIRKVEDFFADSDLKDTFIEAINSQMDECKKRSRFSMETTQSNWDALQQFRKECFYITAATMILDKSSAPLMATALKGYSDALNLKWESAFKQGVSGSKDQVRAMRAESDSILSWARSIR